MDRRLNKRFESVRLLLQLSGGKMNYMKLIKLMYIADRESLRCNRTVISGDVYVAMNKGPVLSQTLNMIKNNSNELWDRMFEKQNYDLVLRDNAEGVDLSGELSQADKEVLENVYKKFENSSEWDLVDHTHSFPEWISKHQEDTSTPISLQDMLEGAGFETDEAEEIVSEEEADRAFSRIFDI